MKTNTKLEALFMKKLKMMALLLCAAFLISGCSLFETNEPAKPDSGNGEKQQLVALFHGIPLDVEDRDTNIFEEETNSKEQIVSKYEKEYYLYSNQQLIQESEGKIEQRGLDYYWQVVFPGNIEHEVALSQSYDPYPRKIENITSNLPKEFDDDGQVIQAINSKFNVNVNVRELNRVDLDGDGQGEFLAFVVDKGHNFFAKCLVNSDYEIISYFTVFQEEYQVFDQLVQDYNLTNSGEIIDINNDEIMEMVVVLPTYEGFLFKVLTYKDGNFSGEQIINTTLKP